MRYAFGCDHAGYALRDVLLEELRAAGHEVLDMGTDQPLPTDYPDYANKVAQAVSSGQVDRGVLVCGTGVGMAMAANKHPGVRAAAAYDCFTARMSRRHNDANVLCLGARVVGPGLAVEILRTWMSEEFEGGRHVARLAKILGGYANGTTKEERGGR
ncbi:MAG: ribose 5-phosphate isomerase B [Thermoleophilia bacterium]|nr:ribose 5-phosphate isomerase B [Thermoleophilia bacterium]